MTTATALANIQLSSTFRDPFLILRASTGDLFGTVRTQGPNSVILICWVRWEDVGEGGLWPSSPKNGPLMSFTRHRTLA